MAGRSESMLWFVVALLTSAACIFVTTASAAPPITAAAIAPDEKLVVLGSQAGIELRSWPDLQATAVLPTDLDHVHDLAISPDGRTLLAAGGAPGLAGVVEVLAWPEGTRQLRVAEHDDVVYRVAWSPDGQQWSTASGDGTCRVFTAVDGRRLVRYEGHSRAVLAICFLPDGQTIVSAGVDQTLQVWESASGKHLRTLDNHVGAVNDLAVRPASSPDALPMVVSVSEDKTVRFWQPTIGRLVRFARLPSTPRAVEWLGGGDRILTGCNDGHTRVLHVDTVEIMNDRPSPAGRIHVLAVDGNRDRGLVAGEKGAFEVAW